MRGRRLPSLRLKHDTCSKRRASVLWRARDVGFVKSGAGARSLHMSLQARECRHHLVYVSPTRSRGAQQSPDLRFGTLVLPLPRCMLARRDRRGAQRSPDFAVRHSDSRRHAAPVRLRGRDITLGDTPGHLQLNAPKAAGGAAAFGALLLKVRGAGMTSPPGRRGGAPAGSKQSCRKNHLASMVSRHLTKNCVAFSS